MKFFTSLFARCWAIWGILTFIITFFLIFPFSMLSHLFKVERKGQVFFLQVSRIWMRIWLTLIGCRLQLRGLHHFKENKNYVVVFNHNSFLDIPLSCPFVPGANKTIGKDSFTKIPFFGWFYKRGAVLINRKNEKSRMKSYEAMKRVLAKDMHMCIYPEGTRNRTNELLKPFYDGAFKLSIETEKEIIPCIISGTKKALPVHKIFYLFPTKLSMQFLPPISPKGKLAKELNKEVFEIMRQELSKKNAGN